MTAPSESLPASPSPTVSVIIPTFNRSRLVLNAIDSVLNQTFRDYELIVVDDGSTDDTGRKLEQYGGAIRYHRQENRGASAAQNKGVELARGQWISILASDDLWLPTKLERQMEAICRLGQAFGACFTDYIYDGNATLRDSAFQRAGLSSASGYAPLDEPFGWILARHPVIQVQSLMVLRSIVLELKGFDERLVVSEDTDLIFRMAFVTKFCFVDEPLVRIDRTPDRAVGLTELFHRRDERMFTSREIMLKKWLALPQEMDLKTHRRIVEILRDLYYNWLIVKLYRLRVLEAFGISRRIRECGDTLLKVGGIVALRAMRKTVNLIRGRV